MCLSWPNLGQLWWSILITELPTGSLSLGLHSSSTSPSTPYCFFFLPSRYWSQGYCLIIILYPRLWLQPASCTWVHVYILMCECTYIFLKSLPKVSMLLVTAARTGISISATCIPSLLAVLGKKRKTSISRYNLDTGVTLFLLNVTFHCFYLLPGALAGISSWKVWCSNMSQWRGRGSSWG